MVGARDAMRDSQMVLEHLRELASVGLDSVSRADQLEDGRPIGRVVGSILSSEQERASLDGDAEETFELLSAVWSSGFENASLADEGSSGRTLGSLIWEASSRPGMRGP